MKKCTFPRCNTYHTGEAKLRDHWADKHAGTPYPEDAPKTLTPAPAPTSAPPEKPVAEQAAPEEKAPEKAKPGPKKGEKVTFKQRITAKLQTGREMPAQVIEEWQLPEKKVEQTALAILDLIKDAIRFIDKLVGYPPIDDKVFELEPAERANLGILLQAPTTKMLKFLGFKTLEDADMFIDGFSIFSAFAFMGMAILEHFWGMGGVLKERKAQGLTLRGKVLTDEQRERKAKGKTRTWKWRGIRRGKPTDDGGPPDEGGGHENIGDNLQPSPEPVPGTPTED